jgi:hypothetical protein
MKWRQVGPGRGQLRLGVMIHGEETLSCGAYVKDTVSTDKREMAKLKLHVSWILQRRHQVRGKL